MDHVKGGKTSIITWFTGYSDWTFYCALMSTFAFAGYYSDFLRPRIPDWLGVALFIGPIVIILFVQWGEVSDRLVSRMHKAAAVWFMLLALGMEVGHFLDYHPKGSIFYRVVSHLGWTFAWAGIYQRARRDPAPTKNPSNPKP